MDESNDMMEELQLLPYFQKGLKVWEERGRSTISPLYRALNKVAVHRSELPGVRDLIDEFKFPVNTRIPKS